MQQEQRQHHPCLFDLMERQGRKKTVIELKLDSDKIIEQLHGTVRGSIH
jgi:hypothetical protein